MRIGVICTPSFEEEIEKDELVLIDYDKRPWLMGLPKEYIIHHKDTIHTTDDISIAYYLKYSLPKDIKVDIIMPTEEDAIDKAKKNDINFLLIFDMLEAHHTLPHKKYERIKSLFKLHNVFPAYEFQYFVNHKHVYFDYFRSKGINVLPFLHIAKDEYENDPEASLQRIKKFSRGDDDKIIGKPVYGQESIGFKVFSYPLNMDRLEHYMERIFHNYKGVVFQPYIKSLKHMTEYKIMFIGNEPAFGIRYTPESDNGKVAEYFDIDDEPEIISFASHVISTLPPHKFKGWDVPRLLTRVDVGCCYGETKYFVSEIEFVPSLFMTDIPDTMVLDALLGNQMIHIIQYLKEKTDVFLKADYNTNIFMMVSTLIAVMVVIFIMMIWVCAPGS